MRKVDAGGVFDEFAERLSELRALCLETVTTPGRRKVQRARTFGRPRRAPTFLLNYLDEMKRLAVRFSGVPVVGEPDL